MKSLPIGSLISGGSVLAISWQARGFNFFSPLSPDTTAVVDATDGKVLWKKAHFAAGAVEAGVVAGYITDSSWRNPRPVGLASLDGHQLWQLNEPLKDYYEPFRDPSVYQTDHGGSVEHAPSMQLAAPGVLLAQGMLSTDTGYTMVTQLLDVSSGAKKMEFTDQKVFYDNAQSDGGIIILYDGDSNTRNISAYDATSFQRLWALPDPAANRLSLDPVGALWHGALYGNGTDHQPAMLDARTGADKTVTLPCAPKVLVPGYALCGDDYSVQVYPIK